MRSLRYLPGLVPVIALITTDALATEPVTENEIIVTAARTEQNLDANLRAATVITRQDIERLQPTDLNELLSAQTGIVIANNGGTGKDSSLYIRGGNTGHVLILVNGIRIGSATLGSATLQDIPVSQIERIEIVRGPVSSLYGSEALSGVIQIFTRKETPSPVISVSTGNHGQESLSATGAGASENGWMSVGVARLRTDGIDVLSNGNQPDTDGYDNESGSLGIGYRFSEEAILEVNALRVRSQNDYDASYVGAPVTSRNTQQSFSAKLDYRPGESYLSRLSVGRSSDIADSYDQSTFVSHFATRREVLNWQNEWSPGNTQKVLAGIDYQQDLVDGTSTYSQTQRSNRAPYLQFIHSQGTLDLQAGFRQDRNEQYGHHNSGNIGAGIALSPGMKFVATAATAFKAPSFNDLYYTDPWGSVGNPALKPEEARSLEIALQGRSDRIRYAVRTFRNKVDNLISWGPIDPNNSWGGWTAYNVGTAVMHGVEIESSTAQDRWHLAGNVSHVQAQNQTDGDSNKGKQLLRRPVNSARFDADYEIDDRISLGTTLTAYGHRYEDAANLQRLPGYTLLGIRAQYQALPEWQVGLKVSNAADIDYVNASNYRQPGIEYLLTLKYTAKP